MSVNKVIILGRLGQNPELKYTPSGMAVSNFTVATNDSWTDKAGQKQERTEWHRIVVWGKLAELCNQYLTKGRQAYIEGRLQTRQWQDKENQTRYTTEIQAQTVQFIGANTGADRSSGAGEYSNQAPSYGGGAQSSHYAASAPAAGAGGPSMGGGGAEPSFTEDDIPF